MIVDVKYINHLNLIVWDYEPLIMMIKFIEILASGVSWARPWKTVSLCIWGWPRPHLHNGWHQGMYSHFWLDPRWARPFWECACVTQIKWRDHDQLGNLGVLTWDVQYCLEEISWCWCVTCTEYGSHLSPINTLWINQLKELLVFHSPFLLLINVLGSQTSHNLIHRKSHYDKSTKVTMQLLKSSSINQ